MAEYRKYMFDNFVIRNVREEAPEDDENIAESADEEVSEEIVPEPAVEIRQAEESVIEQEHEEPAITEPSYSKEELDAAVKLAEEAAYERGFREASEAETQKQNILLEEVNNRLMAVFAGLDEKTAGTERAALQFAVELVRKLLPTLEKERAEAEVKNFLAENFANFAAQETLSFAFNPEAVPLVADSIGRLAEQNDFEGRIAVHKDAALGMSDCRVEWKNGGVERNVSKVLERVENLINDSARERENGE